MPIGRIDVRSGDHDEDDDRGKLNKHHHRIKPGRFADADGEQHRQQQHDDHGWHIGDAAVERGIGQCVRQVHADQFQNLAEITGPTDGHCGGGNSVLQDEIPSDDPRDQLADSRVGIAVGAASAADRAGEFGIAQRRKRAGDTGKDERQDDGRARVLRSDHASEDEDAGADDAADAQHGQVKSAKAAFQSRVGVDIDRFGAEQTHAFSL